MALRKNIMLGTAGHVDHGKTALVKLLTGCDTDRLAVEKQRGLTIELGFAPCQMRDERIVGIVDVPGHVDFIRNMVAGAHGIDVVILVVAADDGVMPQTTEHLNILTLMGVSHGLVALTKIDLVDQEMRELVAEDLRDHLAGTFLADAPICPISNVTGEGFEGFFDALNQAVAACQAEEVTGLFRLWIERAFTIRGFGTVASGIPSGGEVRVGDRLQLQPGGQVGRVRRLEVYGEESPVGQAGECVAVNLDGLQPEDLDRGKLLCEPDACRPVSMVEAELRLLEFVPQSLKDYAEVHLHVGTGETLTRVVMLEGRPLQGGSTALVQLRLARPLCVVPGERFVIRSGVAGLAGGQLTTIGGGRILGTSDVRLRRNRPWTLAALAERRDAIDQPDQWCAVLLKQAGRAMSAGELARVAHMKPSRVAELLGQLLGEGVAVDAGGKAGRPDRTPSEIQAVAHREVLEQLGSRILQALEAFHAANPMRVGADPAVLAGEMDAERMLFDAAIGKLVEGGAVERHGELAALAGRTARVSPEDERLCEQAEAALREAALAPPSPEELAEGLCESPQRVEGVLRLLADRGEVVRLDRKIVMHRQGVEAARKVALRLFAEKRGFTTMEFRDALGVSRKYAVPLLDYFDTVRLTVRSGSRRTPGAAAKGAAAQDR